MTVQESYEIMKDKYPSKAAYGCCDCVDCYLFCMVSKELVLVPDLITGSVVDRVDKQTGTVAKFWMFEVKNLEKVKNGTQIDVKTLIY